MTDANRTALLDGWDSVKLDDITKLITKGTTPSSIGFNYQEEGINFVKVESLSDQGAFLEDMFAYIDEETNTALARSIICENDILYSIAGALGRVAIVSKNILPANTNQALAIIRLKVDSPIDLNYLYLYLKGPQIVSHINCINVQSAQANLSLKDIGSFEIHAPCDFDKQQKIAKILTTTDQLIERTQALIEKYTAIKQGMMANLFARGIDLATGQLRSSAEQAPRFYKETELGWIPKDWDIGLLNDYLRSIEQGWSPDCDSIPAQNGCWGVLKTTSVVWSGFNASKNKALPYWLQPRMEYEVQVGDVLMTRAGPGNRVGVVAYVNSAQEKLMLSDKLYRIVTNDKINDEYLALLLSSNAIQSQLNTTKTGLAESQSNISQDIVKKLTVAIPSLKEQNIIVKKFNALITTINTEILYLQKLKVQKNGLMQDLLTGKVSVQC